MNYTLDMFSASFFNLYQQPEREAHILQPRGVGLHLVGSDLYPMLEFVSGRVDMGTANKMPSRSIIDFTFQH